MCGRVSRPVRIFSAMIARAGRLWRAVPTYSIETPRSRLVVAAGRARECVAFLSASLIPRWPQPIPLQAPGASGFLKSLQISTMSRNLESGIWNHSFLCYYFAVNWAYGERSSAGRALDCGSSGRGFEPRRSPHLFLLPSAKKEHRS